MTPADWFEGPISAQHDRKSFDCGEPELNAYLQRYARQNHQNGTAKCFVLTKRDEPARVLGFYTLSASEVAYERTPETIRKGLGRYAVPVFRLGRLAVDRSVQGQKIGGFLLMGAGERALLLAEQMGAVALLIDAKSPRAAAWYQRYGATALNDAPMTLLLPFTTLAAAIEAGSGG